MGKYLDDPILNEALENYFNELDTVNESSWSATFDEKLQKFIKKCCKKVLENKHKFKYFCLLEAYTWADIGYCYKKCIYYYLYGSNVPFKKELLNKYNKKIYIGNWTKEQKAKILAYPHISYNNRKLDKSSLPPELKNDPDFCVIFYDADPYNDN